MAEDVKDLMKQLESLLEGQILLARQGDFTGIERVSGETGKVVEEIIKGGLFRSSDPAQREKIECLYKQLGLMLTSEKDSVNGQISRMHKGRRMIAKYRSGA